MDQLHGITHLRDEFPRAITAENPSGERGAGGKSSSDLGPGRKGRPCIRSLGPGAQVIIADIDGPGEIRHIWITVPKQTAAGSQVLRDLVIRMYWDNEANPSVEVPVGDFFCNGFALRRDVLSVPVNVNPDGGFNMYWPMPFRSHARLVLENQHPGEIRHVFYQVDYVLSEDSVPEDTAYFHAQWRREWITTPAVDYAILDGVRGRGHYVGTYLALAALDRHWYGEGEFKFYLDGDDEWPTICGTGLEDYFGGAWGFVRPQHGVDTELSFSAPYLGHLFLNESYARNNNSFTDLPIPMHGFYRWHILDPISFHEDIRVTLQQIGLDDRQSLYERQDDISSVAYWYQREPHAQFPELPPVAKRRAR